MLLLSAKPVTQKLTKTVEPLTQPDKWLKYFTPRYDCNGVLNLSFNKLACLTSGWRRHVLKDYGRRGFDAAMMIQARFKNIFRRLRADGNKGSVAIEFAMVAPVFLLMLMATIESGVIFFAQSALQNAVNDAARLVRTGQSACFTKDAGGNCQMITADEFRDQVCNQVDVLLHVCDKDAGGNSDLQFDVKAYPNGFNGVTNSSPLDASGELPNMTAFDTGGACNVVLVRAFYRWPVVTPGLGFLLANMKGPNHLLATAAAFRNEPYVNNLGGC